MVIVLLGIKIGIKKYLGKKEHPIVVFFTLVIGSN